MDLPGPGDDVVYMRRALDEARAAVAHEDVPIGALIVRGGEVIGVARNRREQASDPTAHAEILALREAGERVGSWRLVDCAMYLTLEPCVMCAGAIVLARVPLVVFGAPDPKAGAVISVANVFDETKLNHHPKWRMGVLRDECERVLKDFFTMHRHGADD